MGVPAHLLKVGAALATKASRRAKRLAFLVLSGSFMPVHLQHLRALEIAREVLTNLDLHVVGGFLAPSDDDYVRQKLGTDLWPFAKRLELCRLATDNSPWVNVVPWPEFSSYQVTTQLNRSIELNFRNELAGRRAIGVEIMGSDAVIRIFGSVLKKWESRKIAMGHPCYSERLVCCLVRPGSNASAEIKQIKMVIQPQAVARGVKLIIVGDEDATSLQEVSSSEIRTAIDMGHWDKLRDSGWLEPLVLSRLQSSRQ